jgi:hypothetical protein
MAFLFLIASPDFMFWPEFLLYLHLAALDAGGCFCVLQVWLSNRLLRGL